VQQSQATPAQRELSPGAISLPSLTPLALAPLFLLAAAVAMKLLERPAYMELLREDGLFENLTALTYFISCALFVVTGLALRRRGEGWLGLGHLSFAALCFLVAMEEISWGQRIFQIESPALFEQYNRQQETNLHNFLGRYILHMAYILISAAAAFGWYLAPQILRRLPARFAAPLSRRLPFIVPDRRLMLYFLPCLLLYIYYDYVNPFQVLLWGEEWHINRGNEDLFFIVARDQELAELILALGLLLAGGLIWQRLRRRQSG
jgi:hypothetical protein